MFEPQDYLISSHLFLRLLGLVYFAAFGAFLFQIRGLIGKEGILPIESYLELLKFHLKKRRFYFAPSVFWINCSDRALLGVTALGTILSVLLLFNVFPWLILLLLYVLYISIVSTGQDFLSFGWEGFLLEVTFNAIFLSLTPVPNPFVWISLNLVLFRFHFQGGIVKLLSGDINWRNLTGVAYHYQSQPLPNTIAWYAHKLPLWFQKLSTALMLLIEIIVPFGMLGNQEIRLGVFLCFIGLQFFIWLTGNFSFLNHLTVVLSLILVGDVYLKPIFGTVAPPVAFSSIFMDVFVSLVGIALLFLQIISLWNFFNKPVSIFTRILRWVAPFHLANRYGIFAVMTTDRFEIVVEGSDDGVNWQEYLFYYKASELNRRPRRISPYQPRIDWQAWFLPFSSFDSEVWFQNFLYHLLIGSPKVLSLLRKNPFPNKPPKYIRSLIYLYEFTTAEEKMKTGNWWKRQLIGVYSPIIALVNTSQSL